MTHSGSLAARFIGCWLAGLVAVAVGCGGHGTATDDLAGDGGGSCHGLAFGACRTAAGCVPDVCAGCGCAEQYRGCLDAGETPASCPALGCPSGSCCSSELACESGGAACTAPDAGPNCGACNPTASSCATDGSCGGGTTGMICSPIACSCTGALACVAGCTDDSQCGDAETCDVATARCRARACDATAPCPAPFACTAGTCARPTCTADAQCDGYCVGGRCFADRGECRIPAP